MSTASISDTAPVWAYPRASNAPCSRPDSPPNAAEIWLRAGKVPLERIVTKPAPGTATIDDAVYSKERLNLCCELVDGILVTKPMGYYEASVSAALIYFIHLYLESNPIGQVIGGDGPCETIPDHVRKPDVGFTSFARIHSQPKPT